MRIELSYATLIAIPLVACGAWVLLQLLPVMLVLVSALIIVGTVNPAVQWLEARRVHRGAAIAAVFTGLFILTLLLVTLTIPALLAQARSLLNQEPVLRMRLADLLDGFRLTAVFADSLRNLQYDNLAKQFTASVLAFSTRMIEVLAYSASAVFLALYMMIDRDRLRGWLFAAVPRSRHIRLSRIMINLELIVGGYMRGQVITSALMAGFLFLLLSVSGVPNALAISVFGGAADVLPFIGAFLTMVPAVLSALPRGPVVAIIVLVLMLAYEEFESRVLVPRVYGRTLRLPSAVVLFALLAGGTLYGILGAFLSLPVAATVIMLIEELRIELPGEPLEERRKTERDMVSEREYERRTAGLPAKQAAAIALEISRSHHKKRGAPPAPSGARKQDTAKDA